MEKEKQLRNLVIGLAVVAVVLAGVLAWIWIDRSKMVNDLSLEKNQLTEQMIQLKSDYEGISSNNDSLNVQLTREREKVDQLIERVKNTEATNRSRLRQYEQELGTLRSIMRGYIQQIDSLNTLNISLRKDAAVARDQVKESQQKFNELQSTTEEYAKQDQIGSILKGRGINLGAITSSNKETERSSRTVKLKTCLNLVENSIAAKGPRRVYIRIKGPDGILMTGAQQQIFTVDGEQMIYSAVREVDYQGSELEVCIFFTNNRSFVKGVYNVDVYTEEGRLGSADLLLR
jgi:acetolactate synthase small subunit